jgi:hypothetical protein
VVVPNAIAASIPSRTKTELFDSGFLALTALPTESLGKRWACQNIDIMVLVAMKMGRQDNFARPIEKTFRSTFSRQKPMPDTARIWNSKGRDGRMPLTR